MLLTSSDVKLRPGMPWPLGASWLGNGVNFALFSENATGVGLCLYDPGGREAARVFLEERTLEGDLMEEEHWGEGFAKSLDTDAGSIGDDAPTLAAGSEYRVQAYSMVVLKRVD